MTIFKAGHRVAVEVSMNDGSNLLDTLCEEDREVINAYLSEYHFPSGTIFMEPGSVVEFCYFPQGSAIGSFFVSLDGNQVVETTLIGREGAVGGVVSQGNNPAFARAVVMNKGRFFRIRVDDLDRAKQQSPTIADLFARYADCLMAQVFQSIGCNATHSIEQRAAKWLGAALERTGQDDISMTQEQLASMMGIGRSYASRVVQRFKRDGLLRTRRGGIVVLDRDGLEERACDCHRKVRRHFDTVLAGVYPH
jgi:CRP-like cAMP-binding protein